MIIRFKYECSEVILVIGVEEAHLPPDIAGGSPKPRNRITVGAGMRFAKVRRAKDNGFEGGA